MPVPEVEPEEGSSQPGSGDNNPTGGSEYQTTLYPGEVDFGDVEEKLSWFPILEDAENEEVQQFTGTQTRLDIDQAKSTSELFRAAVLKFGSDGDSVHAIREQLFKAGLYADSESEDKKNGLIHSPASPDQLDAWDLKALQNAQRSMTDAGYAGFVWDNLPDNDINYLTSLEAGRNREAFAEGATEIEYGPVQSEIEEWVDRNGLRMSRRRLDDYTSQVVDGNVELEDVYKHLTETFLVPEYGAYAQDFTRSLGSEDGQFTDAYQLADPYIAQAQELLELPDGSMDLLDPIIHKAMTYKDDKGNPVRLGMTEFTDMVKDDDRWQYTNNAHEEIESKMSMFHGMLGLR